MSTTVDTEQIDKELAKLDEAEKKSLARSKRLHKQLEEATEEQFAISEKRRRLKLKKLVGQQVKIVPRYGCDSHVTDDKIGTLLKVNRTKALVDYGEHGEWRVPIKWLTSVDTEGMDDGCVFGF